MTLKICKFGKNKQGSRKLDRVGKIKQQGTWQIFIVSIAE